MLRLARLLIASVALAVVAAPLVPVPASAGTGGALCSRRCCCKPAAGESCRLSRSCGDPAGEDAIPAAAGTARAALLDAIIPEAAPPAAVAAAPCRAARHPDAAGVPPPVPPPRSSTAG